MDYLSVRGIFFMVKSFKKAFNYLHLDDCYWFPAHLLSYPDVQNPTFQFYSRYFSSRSFHRTSYPPKLDLFAFGLQDWIKSLRDNEMLIIYLFSRDLSVPCYSQRKLLRSYLNCTRYSSVIQSFPAQLVRVNLDCGS